MKPMVPSRYEEIPREAVRSQRVLSFDAFWRSRIGDRRCPTRDDIDPSQIKSLLPYLVLVDIEDGSFRVHFRLCGSHIASYDEEVTGRYLDEISHSPLEERAAIALSYQKACTTWQPVYCHGITHSPKTLLRLAFEGGIWPLSSDGQRVDKCAGIEDLGLLQNY